MANGAGGTSPSKSASTPPAGGVRDQMGTAVAGAAAVAAPITTAKTVVGDKAKAVATEKSKAALGVGGTSARGGASGSPVPGLQGPTVSGAKGLVKTSGALASVPVLGAAMQLAIVLAFLKFLKGMLLAAAAMAVNLFNMVLAAVSMGFKVMMPGLMAMGSGVAAMTGGLISAGTGAIAAGTAVVLFVGGAVGALTDEDPNAQRDGGFAACEDEAQTLTAALGTTGPGDAGGRTTENAETVYSVFSAFGMADENIAGILGNWDVESGVDPTSVEGIFDEPHEVGPKKAAAEKANFTGFGSVTNRGIGLGQWTNERNQALLAYAKGSNKKWSDLPVQLGFMVSDSEGTNADVVQSMIDVPAGSPAQAAVRFHDDWERSADSNTAARESAAAEWMGRMSGWEANQELADSVLAQAGSTVVAADAGRVAQISDECAGAETLQAGYVGDVPRSDDPVRAAIVDYAVEQVGLPYAWSGGDYDGPTQGSAAGAGIFGFDCSGLTASAYNIGAGIRTHRQAQEDYDAVKSQGNLKMSMEELQPGDLVFFNTTSRAYSNHIAIYMGGRTIVHAPMAGSKVRIEKIDPGSFYDGAFIGGGFFGSAPGGPAASS